MNIGKELVRNELTLLARKEQGELMALTPFVSSYYIVLLRDAIMTTLPNRCFVITRLVDSAPLAIISTSDEMER